MKAALVVVVVVVAVAVCAAQNEVVVDAANGVTLSWTIVNGTVTMSVAAKSNGYVAIGFSATGDMVGSSAVIGWPGNVKEYMLNDKTVDGIVPVSDPIIHDASATQAAGTLTMTFSRPLAYPARPIRPSGRQSMIWAIHPTYQGLMQHQGHGSFEIDLATASVASGPSRLRIIEAHGFIMWTAFGVLFPIGMLCARFMTKVTNSWFRAHRMLQVTGTVLVIVALLLAIDYFASSGLDHFSSGHPQAGICTFAILLFQVFVAAIRPHKGARLRKPWFFVHAWLGRFLFIWGPILVYSGLLTFNSLFGSAMIPLLVAHTIVTALIWIAAFMLERQRRRLRTIQFATDSGDAAQQHNVNADMQI
ncbi:Cytochrome b561 domain-containing protein [Plasmodiophora brassicae]